MRSLAASVPRVSHLICLLPLRHMPALPSTSPHIVISLGTCGSWFQIHFLLLSGPSFSKTTLISGYLSLDAGKWEICFMWMIYYTPLSHPSPLSSLPPVISCLDALAKYCPYIHLVLLYKCPMHMPRRPNRVHGIPFVSSPSAYLNPSIRLAQICHQGYVPLSST